MSVDYEYLSRIEPHCQQSFERLVEMAERGEDLPIAPDDEWLTLPQAAAFLNHEYTGACAILSASRVRQRSRSKHSEGSRRGCGVLVSREDLEEIKLIKRQCCLRTAPAVRVFDWLRRR